MSTEQKHPDGLKNTVVAIVGPTSSGKTSLSIELCRRLNGEVIADDMEWVFDKQEDGPAGRLAKKYTDVRL